MLVHLFPLLYLHTRHTLAVVMLHLWPLCQQRCSAETRFMQLRWPSACELHRMALMELPEISVLAGTSLLLPTPFLWPLKVKVSCVVIEAEAWSTISSHSTEDDSVLVFSTLWSCSRILLKFAYLFWWFERPHVSRTLILSCNSRIHACGDRHKCIHPFMNHVVRLGQRLVFYSFSGVCGLFFASVLVKAVQSEDLDGWSSYLWEQD